MGVDLNRFSIARSRFVAYLALSGSNRRSVYVHGVSFSLLQTPRLICLRLIRLFRHAHLRHPSQRSTMPTCPEGTSSGLVHDLRGRS